MLSEKNTLCGPSLLWFTGWRDGSSGHLPFCASASTSVPGAPAPSLATRSQEPALKCGLEICAPDWVATALLSTRQPCAPRSETSLAPVGEPAGAAAGAAGAEAGAAGLAGAAGWPGGATGLACAPAARLSTEVATRTRQAPTARRGRAIWFTAGNS